MDPCRVLIVTGEADTAMEMEQRLAAMGYQAVGRADSGEQAVTLAEQLHPELVLIDVGIQGALDGIAAAKKIRQELHLAVIFLAACDEAEKLKQLRLAESFGCICNPCDDSVPESAVEVALHNHRAEQEIRRMEQLYDVLSQVSQVIVRARSRKELVSMVCRRLVERATVDLAWIGWLDADRSRISPVVHSGQSSKFLRTAVFYADDRPEGQCNPGKAIRDGQPFVCNDCSRNTCRYPSKQSPARFGFRSCGSFPLFSKGRACGVLNLCVAEPGFFQERETELLQEVAMDLSFALDRIESDALHERLKDQFKRQSVFLQTLIDAMPYPVFYKDAQLHYLGCNKAFEQLLGTRRDQIIGKSVEELWPNDLAKVYANADQELLAAPGEPQIYEGTIQAADGSRYDVLYHKAVFFNSDGSVGGVIGIVEDTTECKRAQRDLSIQQARMQAVLDHMPAGVSMCEGDPLRPVLTNRTGQQILGSCVSSELVTNELAAYFQAYLAGTDELYPTEQLPLIRAMRGESVSIDDMEIRRLDGSRVRLEVSGAPVRDSSGRITAGLTIFRDITARKQAEQQLRESEERFRELAENIREIFRVRTRHEMLYVSPAYEEICGKSCESLYEDPDSFLELIHPEDKERVLQVYQSHLETMAPYEEECRIIRPDGAMRWIWVRSFQVQEQGREVRSVGIAEDITMRKEAEETVRLERDLALELGSTVNLTAAMELLLEATMKLDALDAGGIYLVDSETGALQLSCHKGLSERYVKQVSCHDPDSPRVCFAMQGQPGYWSRPAGVLEAGDLFEREGIMAVAAIPVRSEGEVVALLTLGSHVLAEIPATIRGALESIAAHIGAIVSRVRMGEQLRVQRKRLEEANAALKVLLKQRELDRADLEESMLDNVQHLVLPYLEKLEKSRLAEEQRLYLEIVASHLKEITSPFVRKLSSRLLGLTPTEIRVAELVRQGRTSKEIAEILVTSERAVLFHRQNIRKRLGIKQHKVNLQTYLANLT